MASIAKSQVDLQQQQSILASKEQMEALQNQISNLTRSQPHLQMKQDQLASKQDLLHGTITNERQKIARHLHL